MLRQRTPESIVDALTTGVMAVQGSELTVAERRAVAEYLTRSAVATAAASPVNAACADSPRPFSLADGPAVDRLGARNREHTISAGRPGAADAGAGAAADAEVGVRFPKRDVGARAANRGRRPSVRRQPERHGVFARRGARLHLLDVPGGRRPCDRVSGSRHASGGVTAYFGDGRARRLCARRGDRQAALDAQGRRSPERARHGNAASLRGSAVRVGRIRRGRAGRQRRSTSAARSAAAWRR